MSDEADSDPDGSFFGSLWLATVVLVLLTLAVWIFSYIYYGEAGKLTGSETCVVALAIAFLVFGGRWCVMRLRLRRKPKPRAKAAAAK